MNPTTIQLIAAALFAVAILHTFSVKLFERLAHSDPRHGGVWHLLAEVEVVFGFWAMVMMLFMFAIEGPKPPPIISTGETSPNPCSSSPSW